MILSTDPFADGTLVKVSGNFNYDADDDTIQNTAYQNSLKVDGVDIGDYQGYRSGTANLL